MKELRRDSINLFEETFEYKLSIIKINTVSTSMIL